MGARDRTRRADDTAGRRRGGSPRAIGESISTFLKERGLLQAMENHQVIVGWETLVGEVLAREAKPLRIERGTLLLGATSSAHANQLLYLKPWILQRIKEQHPGCRIHEIRVVCRPDEEPRNR